MQELENILEEIKDMLEDNKVIELDSDGTLNKCVIDVKLAWSSIKDIIRKHRNDGWIPIGERLPDVGERIIVCNEKGFRCEAMMTEKGKYFRYGLELGELFGQKIVAWRPLPEPYCPESKEPEERKEWKERILRDFMKKGER